MTPFRLRLAGIAALGLGVRLWAVQAFYRDLPLGFSDNFYYSVQANLLARGRGFIDPFLYDSFDVVEPTAAHPPLYSAYLALWSFVGLDAPTWHRVASCFLGVATIVLVALVARRIAGDRAAIFAAAAAALFPPLWIADGTIVAESLYAAVMAGVLLAGLRLAERRDATSAAIFGVTIAVGALTRSEGIALLVLCAVPLMAVLAHVSWATRLRLLAITAVACLLVVAPWVIRNLRSFEEPVFLAYGAGEVLKVGNCDSTYHGSHLGYWHIDCVYTGSFEPDRSVSEVRARRQALDYIGDNLDRVPVVVAARVGRLWHLYRPFQGADFDTFYERRGRFPSDAGVWAFYGLVPAAVLGGWAIRHQRPALVLTGSLLASATLSAALAFGITRYRIAGDVAFVILAGIGIDALARRIGAARGSPAE